MSKSDLFLGEIDPPAGATHVAIHIATDEGKMGPALQIETEAGVVQVFPISNVSRDLIAATWGDGAYRFAFYQAKGKGPPVRLGPRGGAIQITASPAATKPVLPPAAAPALGADPSLALFAMLRQIQSEERAHATAQAQATIERDRAFYLQLQNMARGPAVDVKKEIREAVEEALDEQPQAPSGEAPDMIASAVEKLAGGITTALEGWASTKFGGTQGGTGQGLIAARRYASRGVLPCRKTGGGVGVGGMPPPIFPKDNASDYGVVCAAVLLGVDDGGSPVWQGGLHVHRVSSYQTPPFSALDQAWLVEFDLPLPANEDIAFVGTIAVQVAPFSADFTARFFSPAIAPTPGLVRTVVYLQNSAGAIIDISSLGGPFPSSVHFALVRTGVTYG